MNCIMEVSVNRSDRAPDPNIVIHSTANILAETASGAAE